VGFFFAPNGVHGKMSYMKNDRAILDEPVEKSRMGAPKLQPRYTVDEYLAMERAAEERHIYLDGEIIAMAGESLPHGYITVNVVISLGTQLKGTRCSTLKLADVYDRVRFPKGPA
jgi:hypothetical protein